MPLLLPPAAASRILGLPLATLELLSGSGDIRSVRVAGRLMFRPEDLDAWVQGLPPAWPPSSADGSSSEPHSARGMSNESIFECGSPGAARELA
jgi:hypothetical protein